MKRSPRSPIQMFRDLAMSRGERRAPREQRFAQKHAREAERIAARTAAESRKTNPHGL